MTYEYDLFEKFPDGSSLWRASVIGLERARIHVSALAQNSRNAFYAINVESGKMFSLTMPHSVAPRDGLKIGRRSKSAVA